MNSQHFQQITSKEVVSSEEEEERENIFQDTLAPNLIRVKPGEKTFFVSALLNLEHKRFYVWFRLVRWSLPILRCHRVEVINLAKSNRYLIDPKSDE